jgi:hypothetical protein
MDDLKSNASTSLAVDTQQVPYACFKPFDIYIYSLFSMDLS